MSAPLTFEQLQAMLNVSEALRQKLVEEKAALLAQPSSMFQPQSPTPEGRQREREAFARGLHFAAKSRCPHA
jgi:hypothetical protein